VRLHVLHEAERWVAVAKPARLACHRSQLCHDRQTVADLAMEQFGRPVHLVHRLDRATSGCLLIAFDPETTRALHDALVSEDARKTYLAMVRGYFRWDDPVEVKAPMTDSHGVIKDAHSVVRSLARSFEPWCSLLEVEPHTGRYHQVRRHLRDLNHPVLRDGTHGDSRANTWWIDHYGLDRLALHCHTLALPTPDGPVALSCPLPDDLVQVWRRLPWWSEALLALPALHEPTLPLRLDEPHAA
jgi:tRNA pseudouridine65 synthase